MRNRILALFLGGILLLSVSGCGTKTRQQTPAQDDNDNTAMTIQTSCGDLYYPADWEELVATRERKTDYGTSVTFTTDYNGEELELFTLNIGGGEGDEIGELTGKDGIKRPVRMIISELVLEGADEETANRIFAMQEDINYIVDHLR